MDPTDLSDAQLDQLADQLAGRLPSGTHGDRVVLSRRAFAAAVGGTLGASGLVALGVDPAAAQAAGQVGTSADPVDAFVYDLDVANALQSDLDAGGNALTNVESLSTEHATVSGRELPERIDRVNETPTTYQITGLSNTSIYYLVYNLGPNDNVYLRLNGDGASTGNYQYWDASGSRQTGQNEFLMFEQSSASNVIGSLTIGSARPDGTPRTVGINHSAAPGRSNISDFGREGSRTVPDGLSSIELTLDGRYTSSGFIEVREWDSSE